MCIHTTHVRFSFCGCAQPIPQIAPFYIPPRRCNLLTKALELYHTQPLRLPEQYPVPFPKPCEINDTNTTIVEVDGLCGECVREERMWGPLDIGVQDFEEEVRCMLNRGLGHGGVEGKPCVRASEPGGGRGLGHEIQEQKQGRYVAEVHAMSESESEPASEPNRLPAVGITIVTTPEVVGAWWEERDKIVCLDWQRDRKERRRSWSTCLYDF